MTMTMMTNLPYAINDFSLIYRASRASAALSHAIYGVG